MVRSMRMQVTPSQQPAASVSPWTSLPSSSGHDRDALAVRTATFAAPIIIFGCDIGQQQLLQLCRSSGLQLQVHDRTALPEPAPFTAARMQRQKELQQQQQQQRQAAAPAKGGSRSSTLKQGSGSRAVAGKAPAAAQTGPAAAATAAAAGAAADLAAAAADATAGAGAGLTVVSDDGEVFGCASVSLSDLAKGHTSCCFELPLRPVSTIRGGSLDWKGRPGRYLEVRVGALRWSARSLVGGEGGTPCAHQGAAAAAVKQSALAVNALYAATARLAA